MEQLYVIKNRDRNIVGKPSIDFDSLWDRANFLDDTQPEKGPYTVDKLDIPIVKDDQWEEEKLFRESLDDKAKKINSPLNRIYYINGEEVKRDDFYDQIVQTSVTDQQMIELENNADKDNPIEIDGDTYFIEQEHEDEEDNTEETELDKINKKLSGESITESLEDHIINLVTFKNTLSGFYDSIDFYSEEEAQVKADELAAIPNKYSDIKIIRMKDTNQRKFLSNEKEQEEFLDNGIVPDKYIEIEKEINQLEKDIEVGEETDDLPDEVVNNTETSTTDEETTEEEMKTEVIDDTESIPLVKISDKENMKFKDDELEG